MGERTDHKFRTMKKEIRRHGTNIVTCRRIEIEELEVY